jgi:hypothetical protein
VILFHRTTVKAALGILDDGFVDTSGSHGIGNRLEGVFVADRPVDGNEGTKDDVILKIELSLTEDAIAEFEIVEEGKPYREWILPAKLVNASQVALAVEVDPIFGKTQQSIEWPGGKENEPVEVLLSFLDRLPLTIKGGVLSAGGVGMGFFGLLELRKGDLLEQIRAHLYEFSDARQAYLTIQLIATLEVELEPSESGAGKWNQEMYEETGLDEFRDAALREPLYWRHRNAAHKEFLSLRKASLSPKILHIWRDFLRASAHGALDQE